MSQRKIRNSWWVDITHNKKRYRKKSPANTKAGARRYEQTLRTMLASGKPLEEPKNHQQLFKHFAEFWFETHVIVHNKPSMVVKTRGILDRLLIPTFGESKINDISTLQVERYKASRSKHVANKTINSELGVLGKCLRDARRWLGVERLPEIAMLRLPPSNFDFLTVDESGELLSELSGVWYDITYTALKTGLRRGELQALRWNDVDLAQGSILVRHSRCAITGKLLSPKGNTTRTIPVTDDVIALLSGRPKDSEHVFAIEGSMFDGQRLNRNLTAACQRIGRRPVTCHVLRHTYASRLAMSGVPIIMIQRLLGHTDIKVTMRYAHLSQESLRAVTTAIAKPFAPTLLKTA